MTAIAERLGHALSAAAPSVNFIMNLWVLYAVGAHLRADRLNLILGNGCLQFLFDISVKLDVQMLQILLWVAYVRVDRPLHPRFWLYVLQLADQVFLNGGHTPHIII